MTHGTHHHPHGLRAPTSGDGWSLLRASAAERLAGAGVLLAVLWALVWWALQS